MYYLKVIICCLPCIAFVSCEKESNYRFAGFDGGQDSETTGAEALEGYPRDGSLAFHENFQSWKREGYVNLMHGDCEEDAMTTAVIMYLRDKPLRATYNGFTVAYTLRDYAVNPACGNKAGTSTETSEVSRGYAALQQLVFYECGQHDSDAAMILSPLPSVSKVRFSVSCGGRIEDVKGLALWKKSDGATAFVKTGEYVPAVPEEGEVFTVEINEKNVTLKFVPALTGKENPVNDGVNRAVRLHDLWVFSMDETGESE
ncbi:MAG: hypothetical protein LBR08_02335 [Bacteroidales bacterium]|jgi:hypothetical protein|nr:hypothetical protein [Bacteroidales bacterium]